MKKAVISTLGEVDRLEATIEAAAAATAATLARDLGEGGDLSALARMKFDSSGCDPLDVNRALNFVEQLNQSFTYLASIEGVRWLFEHQPSHAPFYLNLGTSPGSDIVSADGEVAAETFAATHPDSNNKILRDVEKVRKTSAKHRYVFYLSPVESRRSYADMVIVRLRHRCLDVRGARVDA